MTKSFGTALACIAFTSYLNPIMPIAGERRALCFWQLLLYVHFSRTACASNPVTAMPRIQLISLQIAVLRLQVRMTTRRH